MFNEEFIPQELKNLKQWVGVNASSKLPLVPIFSPLKTVDFASSVNPDTWSEFGKITEGIVKNAFDNYGFVFNNNGIVGIDIDDGFDNDGFLSAIAIDIMRACKSYTEYSRSRRGMHIYVKGKLPFSGRNNRNGVEIYQSGRYFIVTGERLIYSEIIENQEAIDYIVSKYFPNIKRTSDERCITPNIYQPIVRVTVGNGIKITREYPEIKSGSRNISLTSLAGQLYNQGYSRNAVFSEISMVNEKCCKPPLDMREVKTIVRSVTRYSRRRSQNEK